MLKNKSLGLRSAGAEWLKLIILIFVAIDICCLFIQTASAHTGYHDVAQVRSHVASLQNKAVGAKGVCTEKYPKISKNVKINKTLAKVERLIRNNRNHEAIDMAKRLYCNNIHIYRVGILLARAYRASKQNKKAVAIYTRLHRIFPGDNEFDKLLDETITNTKLNDAGEWLKNGASRKAIKIAKPIFDSKEDTYRSGLILARAYLKLGSYRDAKHVYQELSILFPNDKAFQRLYRSLKCKIELNNAEYLLHKGFNKKAIIESLKCFKTGPDYYRSGLIIAKGYKRLNKPDKAIKIYNELLKRYPDNTDIIQSYLAILISAGNDYAATVKYDALSHTIKNKVSDNLGVLNRRLYFYKLRVGGYKAVSTNSYPDDNSYDYELLDNNKYGKVVTQIDKVNRFKLINDSYQIGWYTKPYHGYIIHANTFYSPQHTFLAYYSYQLGVSKNLGRYSLIGSIRQITYNNSSASLYYLGMSQYTNSYLYYRIGIYHSPQTNSNSLAISPIWFQRFGRFFVYYSVGQLGEQLGVQENIKKIPSYSLKAGEQIYFSSKLSLTFDAFYQHRGNLYNRRGVGAYVSWRW